MTEEMRVVCDQLLEKLDRLDRPENAKYFEHHGYFVGGEVGECDWIYELKQDLCQLISDDASCIPFEVREYMRLHGHRIEKGESDSFGWLSAICHCRFGVLYFG